MGFHTVKTRLQAECIPLARQGDEKPQPLPDVIVEQNSRDEQVAAAAAERINFSGGNPSSTCPLLPPG